jgi:hypothetical protein
MEIIKTAKKGKHLDTLEKYYIFCAHQQNIYVNDTYIDNHNPILILCITITKTNAPPFSLLKPV